MTDATAPPTDRPDPPLGYYLERPVQGATLQITGTGASLDRGLHMGPVALEPGSDIDVVLRCRVTEHRHEFDEASDSYQLVNRLKAEAATIVDAGEVASEALDEAEQKIAERKSEAERRKREEAGELPLPGIDGDEPQSAGDVAGAAFGDAMEHIEALEDAAGWRETRRADLGGWKKDRLQGHLADLGCADVDGMTKVELVEEILEWEDADRG